MRVRANEALDKCLTKLQGSMLADGTWSGAGWAGVLQSARGYAALELADAVGAPVDAELLELARSGQAKSFNKETGRASAPDDAGVELYAYSSAQRAVAGRAKAAEKVLDEAKKAGDVPEDAAMSVEHLRMGRPRAIKVQELAVAHDQMAAQSERIDDEALLRGFGTNGGEEFMSYLQTAEALVIAGGEKWESWNDKMHERLQKIQRQDGTWSGAHCITSPVFCTATVVQCLTADHDAELLAKIASRAAESER
jgi:hypothetical protein